MPSSCQSRKRRQHVMPDPQPSSRGSICQGIPLRSTNRMPVGHARSGTHGGLPCGRRGGIGKNGSTRSRNGVGSSAAAIRVHATSPTRDQVSEVLLHALKATVSGVSRAIPRAGSRRRSRAAPRGPPTRSAGLPHRPPERHLAALPSLCRAALRSQHRANSTSEDSLAPVIGIVIKGGQHPVILHLALANRR